MVLELAEEFLARYRKGADDLILWLAYKEAKALIKFDATPATAPKGDKK